MKLDVMRPERIVDLDALRSELGYVRIRQVRPPARRLRNDGRRRGACRGRLRLSRHRPEPDACRQRAAAEHGHGLGGNVLQRTRCAYFRDPVLEGLQQAHARQRVRGSSGRQPLARGTRHQRSLHRDLPGRLRAGSSGSGRRGRHRRCQKGARTIPFASLHRQPDATPHVETTLQPGEIIVEFIVPAGSWTRRSLYLKIRDRQSYRIRGRLRGSGTGSRRCSGTRRADRAGRPRCRSLESTRGRRCAPWPSADRCDGAGRGTIRVRWCSPAIPQRLQGRARAIDARSRPPAGCIDGASAMSDPKTPEHRAVTGQAAPRYEGRAKVTGEARYPSDVRLARTAYAYLHTSRIGRGSVRALRPDGRKSRSRRPGYPDA